MRQMHGIAQLGWIAGFGIIATVAAAATADAADNTGRNEHNYTLKLDFGKYVNGIGVSDVMFTISACPQALCFHVSGRASSPSPPGDFNYVSFSLAGLPCDLHFKNIPHKVGQVYMDSPDWRLTLVSRTQSGNGCALLPPDLAGDYNSVPEFQEYWAPDLEVVRKVEAAIGKLSNFTQFPGFTCQGRNINEFARYYWGYTNNQGGHIIIGQLRLPTKGQEDEVGIHIVSQPNHLDNGGCTIANAFFNADTSRLYFMRWGGYFPPDVGQGGPGGN